MSVEDPLTYTYTVGVTFHVSTISDHTFSSGKHFLICVTNDIVRLVVLSCILSFTL